MTAQAQQNPSPPVSNNSLFNLFGASKGGKNQNKRKTYRKGKGKRSTKKSRGGSCGNSTSANAVMVAGQPNAQTAAPGGGNLLQYQNLNQSSLSPAVTGGSNKKGKKGKKGGAVMDMAVPALLVIGNQYVGNKGLPKIPSFGVTDKITKMFSRKKR